MKRVNLAVCSLACIACLLACVKDIEYASDNTLTVITAGMEGSPESRTVLQSDGVRSFWSPGDKISLFDTKSGSSAVFTAQNTTPSATTTFKGTLGLSGNRIVGIYPVSEENAVSGSEVITLNLKYSQLALEDSYSPDLFPVVAVSEDKTLSFKSVAGGAKFSVEENGITAVAFTSNSGKPLAGIADVVMNNGVPSVKSVSTPYSTVVVSAPGGFVPGKNYYAVFLPGEHPDGITVILKSGSKEVSRIVSSKSLTIKRNHIGKLGLLKSTQEDENASISVSEQSLTFYDIAGNGSTKQVVITNTGDGTVTLGPFDCTGPFYSDANTGIKLAKGKSVSINVIHTPGAVVKQDGVLSIGYGSKVAEVALTGYAFTPGSFMNSEGFKMGYSFDSGSEYTYSEENHRIDIYYDFSYVEPGSQESFSFSFTNKGSDQVTTLCIGSPEGFINYYKDKTYSLQNNRTSEFELVFAPEDKKEYSGDFWCVAIDEVDPTNYICVPVHMTGWSWDYVSLYFSSDSFDFGEVIVGSGEKVTKTVTLTNYGDGSCNIRVECPEGFSVDNDNFIIGAFDRTGKTNKQTLNITFNPKIGGVYSSKIVFSGDLLVDFKGQSPEIQCDGIGIGIESGLTDLGLSVLWSGTNVGADRPEDLGGYYSWGEVSEKHDYSLDNYLYYQDSQYTKYTTSDKLKTLEATDDVCTQDNPSTRLPLFNEWNNLINACRWQIYTHNGVKGALAISKKSGYTHKAIFFPYSGAKEGTELTEFGEAGYYWSSSLFSNSIGGYSGIFGSSGYPKLGGVTRYTGCPARAVADK